MSSNSHKRIFVVVRYLSADHNVVSYFSSKYTSQRANRFVQQSLNKSFIPEARICRKYERATLTTLLDCCNAGSSYSHLGGLKDKNPDYKKSWRRQKNINDKKINFIYSRSTCNRIYKYTKLHMRKFGCSFSHIFK